MFTHAEKCDMIKVYYSAGRNSSTAAESYLTEYPERRQPNRRYFSKLEQNLKTHGNFNKVRQKYGSRLPENIERNIVNQLEINPRVSVREVATNVGVNNTCVWRVFRKNHFKPFKFHVSNVLREGDYQRRLGFCTWLLERKTEDHEFLNNILWTDECRFTNCGVFNRNNELVWAVENPREVRPRRNQVRFGLNIWTGLLGNQIIGPHIFEGTLNSAMYVNFLETSLLDYLENFDLEQRHAMWWQQDGAPPHNAAVVSRRLNVMFPGRWIGNMGPVRWPARSPDLNPLDFFLWGTLKDRVYQNVPPVNVDELHANIVNAFQSIRRRDIQRAINSIEKRARICIRANGNLFEHLL